MVVVVVVLVVVVVVVIIIFSIVLIRPMIMIKNVFVTKIKLECSQPPRSPQLPPQGFRTQLSLEKKRSKRFNSDRSLKKTKRPGFIGLHHKDQLLHGKIGPLGKFLK